MSTNSSKKVEGGQAAKGSEDGKEFRPEQVEKVCCLSAATLNLLGRSSGRDAELLKTVTRVNQLKELG
ncbi:hypothetical protein CCACVL1_07902, partial [Corchorus capsularis]